MALSTKKLHQQVLAFTYKHTSNSSFSFKPLWVSIDPRRKGKVGSFKGKVGSFKGKVGSVKGKVGSFKGKVGSFKG